MSPRRKLHLYARILGVFLSASNSRCQGPWRIPRRHSHIVPGVCVLERLFFLLPPLRQGIHLWIRWPLRISNLDAQEMPSMRSLYGH